MNNQPSFNVDEFLNDVERVNGVPEVISLYGFKKITLAGKTYLAPMSRDESVQVIADAEGIAASEAKQILSKRSYCAGGGTSGSCYPMGGCKKCKAVGGSHGWVCICIKE